MLIRVPLDCITVLPKIWVSPLAPGEPPVMRTAADNVELPMVTKPCW